MSAAIIGHRCVLFAFFLFLYFVFVLIWLPPCFPLLQGPWGSTLQALLLPAFSVLSLHFRRHMPLSGVAIPLFLGAFPFSRVPFPRFQFLLSLFLLLFPPLFFLTFPGHWQMQTKGQRRPIALCTLGKKEKCINCWLYMEALPQGN